MRAEKFFHKKTTTLSLKWRYNNIITFIILKKLNWTRMRIYSLNINHIFDDANSTKTRTLLINHFLNIVYIDNIKRAKNR